MKSSIRVSRGGNSITFRGGAARAVFESMSGTKLPLVSDSGFVAGNYKQAVDRSTRFSMHTVGDTVLLIDTDQGMSITNNAELVVARVLELHGNKRIVYRDTMQRWDELKHDGVKFTAFAPLSAEEVEWCEAHAP